MTLAQFVSMNLGDIKTTTTTTTLGGLPALTATYSTTDEPYIATVVNKHTWALLPNSSIADFQLSRFYRFRQSVIYQTGSDIVY